MSAEKFRPRRYRCGVCGELLLGPDECQAHPGSYRVPWTAALAGAYGAVAEAMRRGEPLTPFEELGGLYREAIGYAETWAGHPPMRRVS